MNEQEIREKAERYCELLLIYDDMLQVLETITKKITEIRKEMVFLEKELEENGVKIKDVEIKK